MSRRLNDTDPAAPPNMAATDPGRADTEPVPMPAFGRESSEIDPLLKAFDRTPVPPAPQPMQRSSSDGADFVAHYAVTRPARSNGTGSHAANVEIRRELGALVDETPQDSDLPGGSAVFTPPKHQTTIASVHRRRQRAVWLVSIVSAVCGVLAVVAMFRSTRDSRDTPPSAPHTFASASTPFPPTLATASPTVAPSETAAPPPIPSPAAPVAPVASALPTPIAQPPQRPKSAPAARPSVKSSDDEFEPVLPR